ncbi:MAG: hypothetical protein IKU11_11630, partial [Clostridia bacterium]|nr:hypothetical protein [Clostridia bacterium]
MAYHPEIMREAREKYREAVRVFNEKEEAKKKSLLKRSPRLQETSGELDRLSLRMAHAALMGLPEEISKIRAQAEEIHQKQGDILAEMGEKRDSLRPHYMCPKCEDAGSTGSGDCECMLRVYKDMMLEKYRLYIGDAALDQVDCNLYSDGVLYDNVSPRMIMEYNINVCRTYAESFAVGKGGGLYISGDCGVGKTYLASATVRKVIERGFYVHCISAMELFP